MLNECSNFSNDKFEVQELINYILFKTSQVNTKSLPHPHQNTTIFQHSVKHKYGTKTMYNARNKCNNGKNERKNETIIFMPPYR